jgi:PEP-CTERM motif
MEGDETIMKKTYGVVVLLLMMCLAVPMFGGAIAMTNVNPIPPPASVLVGALENSTAVSGFTERRPYTLPLSLAVDITTPGAYTNSTLLSPGVLPFGALVNVYYLHFDPVGIPTTPLNLVGSVTFAERILGIEVLAGSLISSHVIGAPGTVYSATDTKQGLDFANTLPAGFTAYGDTITLGTWTLGGGQRIDFSLWAQDGVDDIRIITAVPEPATGLLLLPGLAALALFRRRRARR